MKKSLQNKVVCVTGAARGIGKETARLFALEGAEVWIGDIDLKLAQQTAAEIQGNVHAHYLDVTDPISFKDFLRAANRPIDILINNAGVMHTGSFYEIPLDAHLKEVAIDLSGVITGMHLVLTDMLQRNEGHIVNVASLAGKFTLPGVATYNATKFGVVALSRAVRNEIKHSKVTISTVLPSAVQTDLISGISTKWVPTSSAEAIAKVILASVNQPQAEIAVPKWAGSIGIIEQLLPERIFDAMKNLIGGQRLRKGVNQRLRRIYLDRTHSESS